MENSAPGAQRGQEPSQDTHISKFSKTSTNKLEEVPGYIGIKTRVCRYWIAPENVEQALKTAKFWS
jgi:hypothetical protein